MQVVYVRLKAKINFQNKRNKSDAAGLKKNENKSTILVTNEKKPVVACVY